DYGAKCRCPYNMARKSNHRSRDIVNLEINQPNLGAIYRKIGSNAQQVQFFAYFTHKHPNLSAFAIQICEFKFNKENLCKQ
ncbi:MAG: hypothetical protein IJJ58_05035, partial [Campylobacter sp.]|nr:hypothetical protein [Campylobacter sp.]